MMGGVSQDTRIVVAFTTTAVTFRGGLLGPVMRWKQECGSHENV